MSFLLDLKAAKITPTDGGKVSSVVVFGRDLLTEIDSLLQGYDSTGKKGIFPSNYVSERDFNRVRDQRN